MDAFASRTQVLRQRADGTSSDSGAEPSMSNGCVSCPTDNGSCPTCPSGQQCNLTARTCTSCPQYVCVSISGSNSISSKQIGGIVGGAVGGSVAIALAIFLYYMLVYRKRHPRLTDDTDGYDSKYEMDSQTGEHDDYTTQGEKLERTASQQKLAQPAAGAKPKNRRLSSYESFMRPPRSSKRGAVANRKPNVGGEARPGLSRGSSSFTGSDANSKRESVATTISTTNASNILPIAYIPGVTIRPTKDNTRSIFSYDMDSVFSEFAGIDNASIVQERPDANGKKTTTAVKAQPKLVNVARIDEDIAEEDEDADEEVYVPDANNTAERKVFWNEQSNHERATEGDSDSDVDSDIGEINRATSTRRPPLHENVFEDHLGANSEFVPDEDDDYDDEGGAKSFILNITTDM